jgi:hypothetical protein
MELPLVSRRAGMGCGLLFLLVCGAGCRDRRSSAPPPREQLEWRQVATFSGRGNSQLETFTIEGWTWRVQWEARNESPPGTGTLRVTAHSGDSGRQLAEIADVRGVDHDTTYVTELPHRYYFVVVSKNVDWKLVVEEGVVR